MKGTEKQVAWAEEIKKYVIEGLEKGMALRIEEMKQEQPEKYEARKDKIEYTINYVRNLLNNDDAKFWIETFGSWVQPRRIYDDWTLNEAYAKAAIVVRDIVKDDWRNGDKNIDAMFVDKLPGTIRKNNEPTL